MKRALWGFAPQHPTSACSAPDRALHAPSKDRFLKGQSKAAVPALECAAGSELNLHHQSVVSKRIN